MLNDTWIWLLFVFTTEAGQTNGIQLELLGLTDNATANEDFTLCCVDNNTTLAIRWFMNYKDVATILRTNCNKPTDGSDLRFKYSCYDDGYTLTIPGDILITDGINGTVWSCWSLIGRFKSNNKTLFIYEKSKITEGFQDHSVKVSIYTQNSDTDFTENDLINITCNIDKPITGNVTWTFTHPNNTQEVVMTSNLSESSLSISYTIHRARCEDMGEYSCLFWANRTDYVMESLNITVSCKPQIHLENLLSNRIKAKLGDTVVLSVLVSAFPKPEIHWYFREMTGETRMVSNIETESYFNRHISSLSIRHLQNKNFGTYVVIASNSKGSSIYEIMVEKDNVRRQKVTNSKTWLYVFISLFVICILVVVILGIKFAKTCKRRQAEEIEISPPVILQNNDNGDTDNKTEESEISPPVILQNNDNEDTAEEIEISPPVILKNNDNEDAAEESEISPPVILQKNNNEDADEQVIKTGRKQMTYPRRPAKC